MTDKPDFDDLRRKRDESVERSMQKIADEFGCHVSELRTTYRPSKCYCACASGGPCEHQWDGDGIEFDHGWTATCSRCGATAMSHDMRCAP